MESELPELPDKEIYASLAVIVQNLSKRILASMNVRGLKGHEFHPLTVIHMELFNLLMICKLAEENSKEMLTGDK